MNSRRFSPIYTGLAVVLFLVFACRTSAPTPVQTPTPAPPTFELTSFPVEMWPVDLAFDGENLWAAGGTVMKLAQNGAQLITLRTIQANGVAFDGESMWVTQAGTRAPTLKFALDGTQLGTFSGGRNPTDVLFDGEFIWTANNRGPSVTRMTLDGAVIETYNHRTGPGLPAYHTLAFDGEHIWAASLYEETVTKVSRSGQRVGAFTIGTGGHSAIAFGGDSIWVTDPGHGVIKLALDGTIVATYGVHGIPHALLFDGASMWVGAEGTVTRLALDGTELDRFPVPGEGWPQSLAFDGTSLWIATVLPGTLTKLILLED